MARPIPQVDPIQYMKDHPGENHTGVIEIVPVAKYDRVKIEMANCAVYADSNELLNIMLSMQNAARKQWPDIWGIEIMGWVGKHE